MLKAKPLVQLQGRAWVTRYVHLRLANVGIWHATDTTARRTVVRLAQLQGYVCLLASLGFFRSPLFTCFGESVEWVFAAKNSGNQ